MSILDIRKEKQGEFDVIIFDDVHSLARTASYLVICAGDLQTWVRWDDFNNFIAACHKARELWGPKS